MKKIFSVSLAIMLVFSSVILFTGCSGTGQAQQAAEGAATEEQAVAEPAEEEAAEEAAEESAAEEQAAEEQGVELMGISKYTRTELGMRMEFDVSNHQVNEEGQITQFDLRRTGLEKVKEDGALLEAVDTEDSTIALEYDENGDIILARTDIPGYGFTMHEMTYNDGLIDTNTYSTDWSTVEEPYKLQFTYEENERVLLSSDGKCVEGSKSSYPCEYEYNESGNVSRITRTVTSDFIVYVDIEYDENDCVTKITSTNPKEVFLVCEFEYTSLGQVGKTDAARTGYRKWQEFSVIEEALKNCY